MTPALTWLAIGFGFLCGFVVAWPWSRRWERRTKYVDRSSGKYPVRQSRIGRMKRLRTRWGALVHNNLRRLPGHPTFSKEN